MNYFLWAILVACVWGIVPVLEKAGLTKVQPLTGLLFRCLGVLFGLVLLALFFVKPQEVRATPFRSVLLLMSGGFLASCVAQICFYQGLKMGEVSRVVPIAGSFPLIAFIAGVVFLGESLSVVKVIGAVLVIAGIWALKIG